MNSLISIIIPAYNRADLIISTLESIRNQTYPQFECLIVDDGSEDETAEVVSEFMESDSRFLFYKRPAGSIKGPNTCRNYGFEKAQGDFIYFFDSDDFLKPHALETYIANFDTNTDGVLARVERVDRLTGILQDVNTIESDNLIEDYFTYKVCYFVCGILWRKSFLDKQDELFDESISNHDEWDFNLRMIYAEPKIIRIKEVLVTYFQYPDSFKNEIKKGNDFEINSAFEARFKHLDLLVKLNPAEKNRYTSHIADSYIKTVRNKLIHGQNNWFTYYKSAVYLKFKTNSLVPVIKLTLGIISLKFFGKGYSLFK